VSWPSREAQAPEHIPDRRNNLPPENELQREDLLSGFCGKEGFIVVFVVFGLLFPDDVYTLMHWTG
jgi:hypothetical protein